MVVVDSTVVNVALPSLQQDLQVGDRSLTWVVNAYLLTFGGGLLLGGRLGDAFGHRRLFLGGIVMFTLASVACGLATTAPLLVGARAVQGAAGASIVAVGLSLIMGMYAEGPERTRAVGVYSFICAGGGSIGLLAGGALTSAFGWRWIFLINVPMGIAVYAVCRRLLNATRPSGTRRRLDVLGAATVTSALMLAILAVVHPDYGRMEGARSILFIASAALFAVFLVTQVRVSSPLVPLTIFRRRTLAIANLIGALWAAGSSAWYFFSALYLQNVLSYDPLEIALVFLPANLLSALFALVLSARLVGIFGIRIPLAAGMLLAAVGLALLARAPASAVLLLDILPGMLLVGIGAGVGLNPLLLAAMRDANPDEAGLASGLVNTICTMSSAVGLAILATLADARTVDFLRAGLASKAALAGGYQFAFMTGAVLLSLAAVLAGACAAPAKATEFTHDPSLVVGSTWRRRSRRQS